ncbi:MAG: hypothetical protein HQL03_03710 [Nitrospirae bacterium]|nr:hypothetical protein [Nitrospirota bacterium]MBF0591781.1 hypothetical protein [Nitrospirota bacterium]
MKGVVVAVAILLLYPVVAPVALNAFNQSDLELDARIDTIQRAIDDRAGNGRLLPEQALNLNISLNNIRGEKTMAIAAGRLTIYRIHKLNVALDKLEIRLNKPRRTHPRAYTRPYLR